MSLASHQRRKGTVTWLSPQYWISLLGPFDLDPCCPQTMPWRTARVMWSLPTTDGLAEPWSGRVWLNPPFGRMAHWWVKKLAEHGNGIALLHAATETAMWRQWVWGRWHPGVKADAVCFTDGRPHFHYEDGTRAAFNSGAAIALVAYGLENVAALERADLGIVLPLNRTDSKSAR